MPDKPQAARVSFAVLAALMGTALPSMSVAEAAAASASRPSGHAATVNGSAVGADLNLSPKRVVFDPAKHSATVFVFNQGATSGLYSVELVDEIMRPDGGIEKVADAVDPSDAAIAARLKSAKDLMLITPHRISLGPGESQTVRVRVHPPSDSSAGEYRTHMAITALPPEDMGLTADQAAAKAPASNAGQAVSVRVYALYSLAIPLIWRQGPPDVRGHLDHLVLSTKDGRSALDVDLVRDGANSLFGTVEARVGGPKGEVVGLVNGVAVYPEIDHRHLRLALTRSVAPGERLSVTWRDQDVKPGAVIASDDLTAP
jgi:hypothetical protein